MHELAYLLGLTSPDSGPYLFWSGVGGRIVISTGFIAVWWRHHRCQAPRCRRPGHVYRGSIACRRHRPLD
jgi:hypothetical protein